MSDNNTFDYNGTNQASQDGGARRRGATRKVVKKGDKKPVKRTGTSPSRKAAKQSSSKTSAKRSQSSKKGGSFVGDVQNLAVPFAILLAKEGLSKVFKKTDKTGTSSSLSAKSASQPKSTRRRSTLSGGSCNLGCGAMTGGRAARELFQLQKEIDNFLEKY
jgi:hypothetical protein